MSGTRPSAVAPRGMCGVNRAGRVSGSGVPEATAGAGTIVASIDSTMSASALELDRVMPRFSRFDGDTGVVDNSARQLEPRFL